MIIIKLLPFVLFVPVALASSSNSVVMGASGTIHEVVSLVYSEALNDAKTFLESKGEVVPRNALKNTIQAFGVSMDKLLLESGYNAFKVNGSQTYARALLLSDLVNYSDFDADNVIFHYGDNCSASLKWQSYISYDTEYDNSYGNISFRNPAPVYSTHCRANTLVSLGIARIINNSADADIYIMPYKERWVTGPTPEDILSFIESDNRDIALKLFQVWADSFILTKINEVHYVGGEAVPLYSSCSTSPWSYNHFMSESGRYHYYSVNNTKVLLHSSYSAGYQFLALTECHYSDQSQGSSGVQHRFGGGDKLSISVSAPLYSEDVTTKSVISLFSDNDIFPSWSEGIRKIPLHSSKISALINTLWSLAARQVDYNGIPFYSAFQITPDAVSRVLSQRGLSLSLYNLLEPVSANYSLLRWDEKFNAFVSEEMHPQYRSVAYLSDILRTFVDGQFNASGGIGGSDSLLPEQVKPGSATDNINRSGDVLVFYGTAENIRKIKRVLPEIDSAGDEVFIAGYVFEVQTSERNGSGLALAAKLLGGKIEIGMGNMSGGYENFIRIGGSSLDAMYELFRTDSRFNVVSSPRLRVKSGYSATFSVGQEVPVLSGIDRNQTSTYQSVDYRSAGVILDVTPSVRNSVTDLKISQQLSNFIKTDTGVNDTPTLIKREVSTVVSVKSGDIVVLGGLAETKDSDARTGLSFLPRAFGSRSDEKSKTDILIVLQVRTAKAA